MNKSNTMLPSLVLALLVAPAGALAQARWFPYSYQPIMGCGVDPASKTVVSETIWSGTAFASDSDTWSREKPGGGFEYGVFASSDHDVEIYKLKSGTTMAWVLSSSVNGTKTYTHTIKAMSVPSHEVEARIDLYRAFDNGPGVLDDADIIVGRTVTITGPTGTGGGGGLRGVVVSLLLAAFTFAGGTPGELAERLAQETRHDWVCGVGLEGPLEKFTIAQDDMTLNVRALSEKLAEVTGRPPSSSVGTSPPQLIVGLTDARPSRELEYIAANVLDPEAVRWTDDGRILFGPTGRKCVNWQHVAKALPDEKLQVHWLYTGVYMAGVADHVDVPTFLSLLAASVGAQHVESDGVHQIVPYAPALRGQLAALYAASAEKDDNLSRTSGTFSLAILRDLPDSALLQAVATPDASVKLHATVAQRSAILDYVLAMKKIVPGIVQTFEDAGCFGRPFRVELRADGGISAMFEGPPGPKTIFYYL